MKQLKDLITDQERFGYNLENYEIINIHTVGLKDGESAFKECKNLIVTNSMFELRYPFWHDHDVKVSNCVFTKSCRGPFWYSSSIELSQIYAQSDKAFRECENIVLTDSVYQSDECFWKSKDIKINNLNFTGEYAFFLSEDLDINNLMLKGHYSFQYVNKGVIKNSKIDTKDAFWHAKDLTVYDSELIGEYLGWYSENLTLVRCKIVSHQPLCYCKNLKLIDCEVIDCDDAFEKSEVNGNIISSNLSIYNPSKGTLEIQGEYQLNEDQYQDKNNKINIVKK